MAEMNQLKINNKKTSELESYPSNPRNHSVDQIRQIAKSISEFGFTNPILISDDNFVIAGHGRLYAARLLEMDSVPCIELSNLTTDQKRAYVIADNKLALNSSWDLQILNKEMAELKNADFDMSFIGLDDFESIKGVEESLDSAQATGEGDSQPNFRVVVACEDQADKDAVTKLLTSKGYKCS